MPKIFSSKGFKVLKSTGIADTAFFGPEPEFFLFDDVDTIQKKVPAFIA